MDLWQFSGVVAKDVKDFQKIIKKEKLEAKNGTLIYEDKIEEKIG